MEFLHYTHKSCHNVEGKMCLWEQSWIQQGSRSIYKMAFIPWKNAAQDWLKCAPQSPLAIAPSLQPTKAETVNKQRNRQSHGHTFPHKCYKLCKKHIGQLCLNLTLKAPYNLEETSFVFYCHGLLKCNEFSWITDLFYHYWLIFWKLNNCCGQNLDWGQAIDRGIYDYITFSAKGYSIGHV